MGISSAGADWGDQRVPITAIRTTNLTIVQIIDSEFDFQDREVAPTAGTVRVGAPRDTRHSTRARILGAALVLATLGAIGGVLAYDAGSKRVAREADHALARDVAGLRELRAAAATSTGTGTLAPEQLLALATLASGTARHEAFLAIAGDRVLSASRGETADALRRDPAVLRAAVRLTRAGEPARAGVETSHGPIRLAVEPVHPLTRTPSTPAYAFVAAYALGAAEAEFTGGLARTGALLAATGLALFALVTCRLTRRKAAPTGRLPAELLEDTGHELRTPLTVIRGHLELLDSANRADVVATRALVLGELDRMSRLVDDLSTLTHADRPGFLRPSVVTVRSVLDEVYDKARVLGDRAWQVDARTDAMVVADPQRLTQALLQLVHNAVKATAVADTVALGSRVDPAGRTVRLWVRDEGQGVRPEDARRIFRRHVRGTPERVGTAEGVGLGLTIVAAIARAHAGRVELESAPGHGATFTLVLPLAGQPGAYRAAARSSTTEEVAMSRGGGR